MLCLSRSEMALAWFNQHGRTLRKSVGYILSQLFQFELKSILFDLTLFNSKRRITNSIAHYIDLRFKICDQAFLQFFNLFCYSVCHGTNSLSKNTTLTFNCFNLCILGSEKSLSVGTFGWAILALLAFLFVVSRLKRANRIMQFKYFLAQCEALLGAHG